MKNFNKIFFQGLVTLLPIAVTIYILYSAVTILDSLLGGILHAILPESLYFPGLGLIIILALIYGFGLILNSFVAGRVFSSIEKRLIAVPFIKTIYSPLRDLMNLFSKSSENKMGSVVLVRMGNSEARALGLVTRESFADIKLGESTQNKVAVYFPLSYGLGGFTFLIPKENIEKIDMPVEKAMSLAITGWVHADQAETSNKSTFIQQSKEELS